MAERAAITSSSPAFQVASMAVLLLGVRCESELIMIDYS
jgi:hypothetical protein